MNWARILAYDTGTVDQELLLRNEYLAAENRILKAKLKGRVRFSDAERAGLSEIGHRLGRKVSECPAVVIPVMTQHYTMLQRNLLYTGVTRGKRLVVLVGQTKAIAIAVRNVSGRCRWSKLHECLGAGRAKAI
jgi:hypothetical protein